MSKKLTFPSLILLAGALVSPLGAYADVVPDKKKCKHFTTEWTSHRSCRGFNGSGYWSICYY